MADLKNEKTKQEHQKNTYRKAKRALQVILGALLVLALILYIKSYGNDGGFLPDTDTQEVKNNQILFPDEEAYDKNGGGDGDDSDLWEQDEDSENSLSPEEIPDSSVLFQTQQGSGTQNKAAVANDATPVTTTADGNGVVFVAGSDTDGVKIAGGTGQAASDGSGSGSGNSTGGNGTGGSSDSGNSGTDTKKNYDIADPTPKVELSGHASGIYDANSDSSKMNGTYMGYWRVSKNRDFYYGESLTAEKILSAVYAYVYYEVDDDLAIYQITSFGTNFEIVGEEGETGYPETAEKDFSVTFRYRSSEGADWENRTVKFQVKDYCVVFEGIGKQAGEAVAMAVLDEGETLDLTEYYQYVYGDEYTTYPYKALSELFLGWSETVGGTRLESPYAPSEKGRTILYACDTTPVPDGYTVVCNPSYSGYTLSAVETYGEDVDLAVPYGVGNVSLYYAGEDENGEWIPYRFQTVSIPETVTSGINTYWLLAKTAYEVAKGNETYSSFAGALYNKDQTTLLGVPYGIESLYLPDTVTEISAALADGAALKELHIISETVPEVNWYTFLGNNYYNYVLGEEGYENYSLDVYVPESAYYQYLDAWQDVPDCIHIKKETGETPTIVVKDGAVLSEDGTILYSVLASTTGIYFVPDTVTRIADGAFDNCDQVTKVVFGTLGTDGKVPEISSESFGDHIVYVPEGDYVAYLSAWSEALGGEEAAKEKIKTYKETTTDGWKYIIWQGETTVVLEKAPADITVVNPTVLANVIPGDLTLTTIADSAFSDCTNLTYVVLPESVTEIGNSVFSGCTSLQLIYVASGDTLKIGNNNFTNCDALKMIVLNAATVESEEEWDTYAYIYAPLFAEGYGYVYDVTQYFDSFAIEETGGGYVIYGQADSYETGMWALAATPDISENVSMNTETYIIHSEAFSGCTNAFSLNWEELTNVVEIQNQAFSGSGLTECVIGEQVTYVGEDVFSGCTQLTQATLNGGLMYTWGDDEGEKAGTFAYYGIQNGIFNNCTALKTVTFGDRDVMIGAEAFSGCTSLTSLTFPDAAVYLEKNAFSGMSALNNVTFTSATVPTLFTDSNSDTYTFGVDLSKKVNLAGNAGGQEQSYIDVWKYDLVSYDDDSDTLTEAQDLEGTNLARALFGMEPLTSLTEGEAEEPEAESSGESSPDAQAEQDNPAGEANEEKETGGGQEDGAEDSEEGTAENAGENKEEDTGQAEASGDAESGGSAGQSENEESEQEETP